MKSQLSSILFILIAPVSVLAQRIGLHTATPNHPIHIVQPSGSTLGSQMPLLFSEYTGINPADAIAVKGLSKPADFYGIGGDFEGGWIGVRGKIIGGLNSTYYGMLTDVAGPGTGNFYGLHSFAHGSGTNYAVYGQASGGTKNWAGYFGSGDVHISNKLAIGLTTPQHPIHIVQPAGTVITGNFPVMHVEYTGNNTDNVIAIRGRCFLPSFNGIGGQFEGGDAGVVAEGSFYGVKAYADSDVGVNVGIFAHATGAAFNYAGYFAGGVVYIQNRLGIGRDPATNKLEIEGNASKSSAGDWLANSDERLKKNIQPLDEREMIGKLLSLKGITYEWNDDKTGSERPEGIQYGFTAQNIQKVFPTLVEEDAQGFLQTSYSTYDAMIIEAIRFLYQQNQMLMAELEALKKSESASVSAN